MKMQKLTRGLMLMLATCLILVLAGEYREARADEPLIAVEKQTLTTNEETRTENALNEQSEDIGDEQEIPAETKRSDELKEERERIRYIPYALFIIMMVMVMFFFQNTMFSVKANKIWILYLVFSFLSVIMFYKMAFDSQELQIRYEAALLHESIDIYKEAHYDEYPITDNYLYPGETGLVYEIDFDELVKINFKLADDGFRKYGLEENTGHIYHEIHNQVKWDK